MEPEVLWKDLKEDLNKLRDLIAEDRGAETEFRREVRDDITRIQSEIRQNREAITEHATLVRAGRMTIAVVIAIGTAALGAIGFLKGMFNLPNS